MERASRGATDLARWVAPAATAAGILWGAQGAIWVFAPKAQEATPPYRVIDRPLFAIVWLAVVGALLCSALALRGLCNTVRATRGRIGRAGSIAALVAAALAVGAGAAALLAALGVAEGAALDALSLVLNGGGLALLAAAILVGTAALRGGILPGRARFLPLALATLTLLTLGAIAASGTRATAGLILAVGIVTLSGATWLALGWTLRAHDRSR